MLLETFLKYEKTFKKLYLCAILDHPVPIFQMQVFPPPKKKVKKIFFSNIGGTKHFQGLGNG